ncbi:M20 metallopeptidase family protein [Nanchangia anserum]|uniref:Amidohydrolase n=1 Tax=Nanchangia anserum TaxID=2692125 RepID=A0A8I0KRR4_9ACTO|nr:M20 family metallopeptidase [Nanchangia anserum]MBD3689662.1 amidohydrolase [Nanchangia anserum]
MTVSIAEDARALADDLVDLRHRLHQIPEVGLDLPRTGDAIAAEIRALGLEMHEATRVTGYMAILRGGKETAPGEPRPLVLLRADMDALPVSENTGLEWASTNGAMHGCGHDLHMAGLVGAMRMLSARAEELGGDVIFMFQPGEEGHDGAQHLIDEGLLEAAGRLPDHAYGLHVWAGRYPAGFIGTRPGPMMASSDTVGITIIGRGGHGSAPHEALDPIPVAANLIQQAQVAVAREFSIFDPVVVTCGQVHAGSAANVIPDEAYCEYTLRAFSPHTRTRVVRRLMELATSIAESHGMSAHCEHTPLYPVTMNDADEFAFCRDTIDEVLPGRWATQDEPMAAAEDFSKVLERIPGCFIGVSAVPEGAEAADRPFNHSAKATFSDDVVADCSTILASLAYARLT